MTYTPARTVAVYALTGVNTGSHTLSISYTGTDQVYAAAISYTGVDQTTPVEAHNSADVNASSMTIAATSATDNAWAFMFHRDDAGGETAGTGATQVVCASTYLGHSDCAYDSDGAISPAGSYSMTVNHTSSTDAGGVMAVLKPYP